MRVLGALTVFLVATLTQAANLYVWTNSPSPLSPYGSWNTAARTIQDAVQAAAEGDTIWVTNGVYNTGGLTNYPSGSRLLNRVAITKAVVVQSTSGPSDTIIDSAGAIARCVYLAPNATLIGFTLTNGVARRNPSNGRREDSGGGIWCEAGSIVSNCVVVGNVAGQLGGGVYGGTIYNSVVANNIATNGGGSHLASLFSCSVTGNMAYVNGGGVYQSTVWDSSIVRNSAANWGGGAYSSALHRCTIARNVAQNGGGLSYGMASNCAVSSNDGYWGWAGGALFADVMDSELYGNTANVNGGGAAGGTLRNCLIRNNGVNQEGGGTYLSSLRSCTVVYNGAFKGGGISGGTQENCIVYFNTASTGSNYWICDMRFTCTTPDFGVQGCFDANPQFIDVTKDNYRLQYGSPCIDRGTNYAGSAINDLDGYGRPLDGDYDGQPRPDVGAYEYNPSTYDMDGDGMPDGHELTADTNPLSTNTFLGITRIQEEHDGVRVYWHGGIAATQYLERSTGLGVSDQQWERVFTNPPPTPISTDTIDTVGTNTTRYYRIRVAR